MHYSFHQENDKPQRYALYFQRVSIKCEDDSCKTQSSKTLTDDFTSSNDHIHALAIFIFAFYIFVGYILFQTAHASPWPRQPKSLFIATGTEFFKSRGDFLFEPPPLINQDNDLFTRIQSTNYLEFGLNDKWLTSFKINYAISTIRAQGIGVRNSGITEIEGRLQRLILKGKRHVTSLSLGISQNDSAGGGARPQLQSEGIDSEIRLLYGRTHLTKPVKIYSTAEFAYRRRFGSAADQLRGDGQLGISPHDRVLILVDLFSNFSLRNEDEGGADFDVIKIQPSLAFRYYRDWHIQVGSNFEINGRNLPLGNGVFINFWTLF